MTTVLPILMLGLAGLLIGGAISVRRQGGGSLPVVVLGLLGTVAAVAGIFWMAET
jgi:hypothetical protein